MDMHASNITNKICRCPITMQMITMQIFVDAVIVCIKLFNNILINIFTINFTSLSSLHFMCIPPHNAACILYYNQPT